MARKPSAGLCDVLKDAGRCGAVQEAGAGGAEGEWIPGDTREDWRSGRDPGGTGSGTLGHVKEQIPVTLKGRSTEFSISLAVGRRECASLQALRLDTMIQPSSWR